MVGCAGSPTRIVYVDVTLTWSKIKVKGLLNFRQLAKPCILVAMTAAPLRGFLVPSSTSSHTRYGTLVPELIPVYRQWACRWLCVIHPAVNCHYFPPGLRLSSQQQSIAAPWPVPSYTAWCQSYISVNNLPKFGRPLLPGVDLNPRPVDRKSNALPVAPPRNLGPLIYYC